MAKPGDTELSFRDYLRVLERRGLIFLAVTGTILLVGVTIAYRTPPQYQSTGVLLVQQPEVPESVVQSTIPNYPDERVRIVTQRVLTRENLQRIVEEAGLYPELAATRGEALAEFRRNLALSAEDPEILEDILGASRAEGAIAFSLSFTHSSPNTARDVTERLVSLYLEENQRARQQQAEGTTRFLRRQVERLEEEIRERDRLIAEFKEEHGEALPDRNETNMQLLDRTERDLEDVEREIRVLRERRALYSSELVQLSPYETVVNEEGETVLGPQERLEMLQREYTRLSARYTAEHPNVARIRREIMALGESTGMPAAPSNAAYIQRQVQLEAARVELQAALDRREALRSRLAALESRLTASPEVEREYGQLQRGHGQLLAQYDEVQSKLRAAQMALNLESEQKGERFAVLGAPGTPSRPSEPNRIAVLLLTVALAFAMGAGSVAVAESLDTTIRDGRDVSRYLEIPPLVAIPRIHNRADVRRIYARRLLSTTAACAWAGAVVFLVMTPAE